MISHRMFADDVVLFVRATETEATTVKRVLQEFENLLGQKINYDKSEVFFSYGTQSDKKREIMRILDFKEVQQPKKYLGLPVFISRSREEIFRTVKERIFEKTTTGKAKTLSQAGREVMIKSVLQAIPSYILGVFRMSKHICDDINNMMSHFWWGGDKTVRKIH